MSRSGDKIRAIIERVNNGVVPTANPCPSRDEWNAIVAYIDRLESIFRSLACPVCGETANTFDEEISHMQERHPEVIDQRLIDAGFSKDPVTGAWIDTLAVGDA